MRLSLLLPARRHLESTIVASWLARGDRTANAAPGREAALRECFRIDAEAMPIAALMRSIDAADAADALWLRADPAFVMADAVTLRLLACGNLGLSTEEVEALAQTLKPLFAETGFAFDAPHPQRWYLRCPRNAVLPRFSSPADALGDDLAHHLPEGENARRWRGLLNEAQIVLTQHPVNVQRARRGLPPVNCLWVWGAGELPQRVGSGFDCCVSDDEIVAALARLAQMPSFARKRESGDSVRFVEKATTLDSCFRANDEQKQWVLVDLADQRDVAKFDDEWFAPLAEASKRGKIAQLDLLFESGERCVVKPTHRWRFWRRAQVIA